jgi:hypothetical protein
MIACWTLSAVLLAYVAAATAYWLWAAHALRRMARDVRAVHVTDLPEGWLGKANALNTGLRHAGGGNRPLLAPQAGRPRAAAGSHQQRGP